MDNLHYIADLSLLSDPLAFNLQLRKVNNFA